jgi:hypothetical protein
MENPSLREQPREQKAPIMASRPDASILGWLEGSGRLMDRDNNDERTKLTLEEDDSEDIAALMGGDDFDDDED